MRDSLPSSDFWQPKARTLSAMAHLCWAQLLVWWIPFNRWRNTLGFAAPRQPQCDDLPSQLAADVEWGAKRLPFDIKCLPRAMALSWMLRRCGLKHAVVIAVRPSQLRHSIDALHAWVELDGEKILGDLPGPWIETVRLEG